MTKASTSNQSNLKENITRKGNTNLKENNMPTKTKSQDLIVHTFKNFKYEQRKSDGYYNATQMCEIFNKRFNNYHRTEKTQKFLKSLSAVTLKSVSELVLISKGGDAKNQKTFIHPLVANHLAFNLDSEFAVEVSLLTEAWKQGRLEYKPKPSKHHQKDPQWQQARIEGKPVRRTLGDTLKQYGKTAVHHISITNQGYRGLRGTDAKGIKKELALPENANVRDYLSKDELEALKFGEEVAIFSMDKQAQNGNTPSCSLAGRDMKDAVTAFKDLRRRFIS